jgi:hypothetical protein
MKRLFSLILVGCVVAGCKSQTPMADPFFGRTTIPPPATGSVTGRPGDPCYQPPPLTQPPAQAPSGVFPPQVQLPSQPSSQSAPGLPSASAATSSQPAQPSGIAPSVSAPRPSSTSPGGGFLAPRPSSTSPSPGSPYVPPSSSPYTPPGNSFNYRGASTQRSTPPALTQWNSSPPAPAFTNVAATRPSAAGDDRLPGPVDDTAGNGSASNRQTMVRTLQPRVRDNASDRPVDIMDLPNAP